MFRMLLGFYFIVAANACLDDLPVDGVFPCREADDCVEGFVCHPTRFVCVDKDEVSLVNATSVVDAGSNPPDAGGL